MKKNILVASLLVALGATGGFVYLRWTGGSGTADPTATADFCAKHQIAEKDCPWCDPSLVKAKGQCPEHRVPEALCAACNPALVAGFKAEGDWCGGHGVPESQCVPCGGGDNCAEEK